MPEQEKDKDKVVTPAPSTAVTELTGAPATASAGKSATAPEDDMAQHFFGEVPGFIGGLRNLHSSALAAAAGMDLRFDDDSGRPGAEQFFGRRIGFFARGRHRPAGHSYSILLENAFSLILMDFHNRSSTNRKESACGYRLRAANL